MKKIAPSILSMLLAAYFSFSCASAPEPAVVAAPVAKERTVTVRVPILVEEKAYLSDGSPDRTTTWIYDADFRFLLERAVVEPASPEPVETLTREPTSAGVIETLVDAEGRLVSRKTITLDESGRKTRESVEGSAKERGTVSEWSYDAEGKQTEWRVMDADGATLAVTRYEYVEGRLSVARMLDPSGLLEGTLEYAYDPAGLLVSRKLSDASGTVERAEILTWRDGVLVEEKTLGRSGAVERRAVHEPGPDGVVASTTVMDGAGRVRQKLVYTYAWREETRVETYFE